MLLLCGIGIVVALIRWKIHPRVSMLVLIALSMELILSIVFMFLFFGIGVLSLRYAIPGSSWLYTALYVVQSIFFSIMVILFVKAAFTDRPASISAT